MHMNWINSETLLKDSAVPALLVVLKNEERKL